MNAKFQIINNGGMILVLIKETFTFSEFRESLSCVFEKCLEQKKSKLLLDARRAFDQKRISIMDIYDIVKFMADKQIEYKNKGLGLLSVAFVGHKTDIDYGEFGENVGENRGLHIKMLFDVNSAYTWLGMQGLTPSHGLESPAYGETLYGGCQ